MLDETKGFKFQITLVVAFNKELNKDETKVVTNYYNSNAELIINDLDIDESLELPYQAIMSRSQIRLRENTGWLTEAVGW